MPTVMPVAMILLLMLAAARPDLPEGRLPTVLHFWPPSASTSVEEV